MKLKEQLSDPINIMMLLIPIGLVVIFSLGEYDINHDQVIFQKISLDDFKQFDCDLQLKYLMTTLPPETHRQWYIDNCMENKP